MCRCGKSEEGRKKATGLVVVTRFLTIQPAAGSEQHMLVFDKFEETAPGTGEVEMERTRKGDRA